MFDQHAEEWVTSYALSSEDRFRRATQCLGGDDFVDPLCRAIMGVLVDCRAKSIPHNDHLKMVFTELRKSGHPVKPERVGYKIGRLLADYPTMDRMSNRFFDAYLQQLQLLSARRLAHDAGVALQVAAESEETDLMLQSIRDLEVQIASTRPTASRQVADGIDNLIVQIAEDTPLVHSTGLPVLDEKLTGGFRPGEMITIAAATGAGKSALALFMATSMAREGKEVLYISREMKLAELQRRILSNIATVPLNQITAHLLTRQSRSALVDASPVINTMPLRFVTDSPMKIMDIETHVRNHHTAHGLSAVFVDYLQILTPDDPKSNQFTQLSQMTRGLKDIAMGSAGVAVPLIVLSQFNREGAKSDKPSINELAGSSSIGNDSDIVFAMARSEGSNYVTLSCEKYRNGQRFTLQLEFDGRHQRFGGRTTSDESDF